MEWTQGPVTKDLVGMFPELAMTSVCDFSTSQLGWPTTQLEEWMPDGWMLEATVNVLQRGETLSFVIRHVPTYQALNMWERDMTIFVELGQLETLSSCLDVQLMFFRVSSFLCSQAVATIFGVQNIEQWAHYPRWSLFLCPSLFGFLLPFQYEDCVLFRHVHAIESWTECPTHTATMVRWALWQGKQSKFSNECTVRLTVNLLALWQCERHQTWNPSLQVLCLEDLIK